MRNPLSHQDLYHNKENFTSRRSVPLGNYVLALKGNQKGLHKEIVAYIDEQMENDFERIGARKYITQEKGHGRDEQRIYVQMPVPKHLAGNEKWKG